MAKNPAAPAKHTMMTEPQARGATSVVTQNDSG